VAEEIWLTFLNERWREAPLTVMTVEIPRMMKVMTVPLSLAVRIPPCTPESFAGQRACSL